MSERAKLTDMLETAELLTGETTSTLEVLTFNQSSNQATTVIFSFNEKQELVEIYTED